MYVGLQLDCQQTGTIILLCCNLYIYFKHDIDDLIYRPCMIDRTIV